MWRRRSRHSTGWIVAILAAALAVPALGVVVRQGNLQISISAQLQPYKLPRIGTAPINVFIAGHIASTDGQTPPRLHRMEILLNRHGRIDTAGLPACHLRQIRTATNHQALRRCGRSLVGSGHFWASIVLPSQPAYHTTGRLTAFNGTLAGRPALFAHIYTSVPFPSSFAIGFSIRHVERGAYGTELSASLPEALGSWGFVNRIKLTIGRRFQYRGERHGYVNAGCPAAKGFGGAVFPLALATFHFAGSQTVRARVDRSCGVRE